MRTREIIAGWAVAIAAAGCNFGSTSTTVDAGGYFRTGQSLDYRDRNSFSWWSDLHWWGGLLYNQWLGMVLRAMGLSTQTPTPPPTATPPPAPTTATTRTRCGRWSSRSCHG